MLINIFKSFEFQKTVHKSMFKLVKKKTCCVCLINRGLRKRLIFSMYYCCARTHTCSITFSALSQLYWLVIIMLHFTLNSTHALYYIPPKVYILDLENS